MVKEKDDKQQKRIEMIKAKYTWNHADMDDWYKEQVQRIKDQLGIQTSTAFISKIVVDGILKPNNINIPDLIKPKTVSIKILPSIGVESKWKKKKLIF